MTKQELIVLRGLPASGKSTTAANWVNALTAPSQPKPKRAVVSRDAIRQAQFGSSKAVLTYEHEQTVTAIQQSTVRNLLDRGFSVMIDDLNLRPRYVREWRRVAAKYGVDFSVLELPITVAEAIERDAVRTRGVGAEVILNLAQKFYPKGQFPPVPEEEETPAPKIYVPNPNLPSAIVVDIDGTVALMDGVRGPYDLDKVLLDKPNKPVIEAIKSLERDGFRLVFCSGREDFAREDTVSWIYEHVGPVDDWDLHMRKAGDGRKDFIVKAEMFDSDIAPNFNVIGVFDDRNSVVQMWRDKGLTVFQVADGDF